MKHLTPKIASVLLVLATLLLLTGCSVRENRLPDSVYGGKWDTSHCQGIAVDDSMEYMYFSFTTKLVKVDLSTGEVVGTVSGWSGHLGDLAYYNGKVYGSLEYYYPIGSFYAAVFDCDQIAGDTEHTSCMTTMYLSEVNYDYTHQLGRHWSIEEEPSSKGHAYGCSGIDGIAFGTIPGDTSGKIVMMVNYGVYKNRMREDNNYQIMLQYDPDDFLGADGEILPDCGDILDQSNYHAKGPEHSMKYFIYTGNTNYGVQNLEYDSTSGNYLMAVYEGNKVDFPNYRVFYVDGAKAPVYETLNLGDRQKIYSQLTGSDGTAAMDCGYVLGLAEIGRQDPDTGIWGSNETGADMNTGVAHLYDDCFYITTSDSTSDDLETATADLYLYNRAKDQWIPCRSLRGRLMELF